MSERETRILQNQIEMLWTLSYLARCAAPDLVGKAGELDRLRHDLATAAKDTKALLESSALPDGSDGIEPHAYSPDHQAMGDCRVCGHGQITPWHTPTSEQTSDGKTPVAPEPGWLAPTLDKAAQSAIKMPEWMTRQAVPDGEAVAWRWREKGFDPWKFSTREPFPTSKAAMEAADEIEKLRSQLGRKTEALEIIAGVRQWQDNLLSNSDIARLALSDESLASA